MEGKVKELQLTHFENFDVNLDDSRYRKISRIFEKLSKKGNILEVGCADGGFLFFLKNMGWTVYGFELSENSAKKGLLRGINIKVGDINDGLPFDDGSMDIILAAEIIEHSFNDAFFLDECYRKLTQDGKIILTTPNLVSLKNRFLMLLGLEPRFAMADYHYHIYTKKHLAELLITANFRDIQIMGDYVVYSKCREKILGSFFETLGNVIPSLSEHFIVVASK